MHMKNEAWQTEQPGSPHQHTTLRVSAGKAKHLIRMQVQMPAFGIAHHPHQDVLISKHLETQNGLMRLAPQLWPQEVVNGEQIPKDLCTEDKM